MTHSDDYPVPSLDSPLEGLEIRYSSPDDLEPLKQWLSDPEVATWFPMTGPLEIDDAARRWISFCQIRSCLTATYNGKPCGIIAICLQGYKKISHQAEFSIIVAPEMRSKGVGTYLLQNAMALAKERFNLEILQLQVYFGNPALRLYERLGFKEYARQTHWMKQDGKYVGRIFMEKYL